MTTIPLKRQIAVLIVSMQLAVSAFAIPTANDFSVRTLQGETVRTVDLSRAVSGDGPLQLVSTTVSDPAITITPLQGTTFLVAMSPFFVGQFTVTYTIVETNAVSGPQATGTITVTIVPAPDVDIVPSLASQTLPGNVIGKILQKNICNQLQGLAEDGLTEQEKKLVATCFLLKQAAGKPALAAKLKQALKQITPEEVAAQIRLNRDLARNHVKHIRMRMAGIRQGLRGLRFDNLSFNLGDHSLPGSLVQHAWDDVSGGGASADSSADSRAGAQTGAFISGLVSVVERDQTSQENGFDLHNSGLTAGMDFRLSRSLVLGVAGGYTGSQVDLSQQAGELDIAGFNLTHYGTYYHGHQSYVDYILSYNQQDYSSVRHINFQPDPDAQEITYDASGDTNSRLLSVSISGGLQVFGAHGWSLTGKSSVDYTDSTIDAYKEKGADAFDFTIDAQRFQALLATAGFQLTKAVNFAGGVVIPQWDVDWVHQFENDAVQIKGQFINDRFGNTFAFASDKQDQDYFTMGLGAQMVFAGASTAFIQYEASLDRQHYSENQFALGLRLSF